MLKRGSKFFLLIFILFFGSISNVYAINNFENDIILYSKEDKDKVIEDIVKFLNRESNNLMKNSYYNEILNQINILQKRYQEDLLMNVIDREIDNDYLFDTSLKLNEFSQIDQKFLSSISDEKILKNQIIRLKKAIQLSSKYYIKTDLGVKIYPSFISEFNNNLQTAIINREAIIYNDYNEYINNRFYSKLLNGDSHIIESRLSDTNIILNLFVNLDLYNNIKINPIFIEDLEVYIAPFKLNNIAAFAYSNNKNSTIKSSNESIYITNEYKLFGVSNTVINNIKDTSLHELGHIIAGRSNFKELNYNIYNEYLNLEFKIDDNFKDEYKNNIHEFHNTGNQLLNLSNLWREQISENFAEDFTVFISNKLPDRLKYKTTKNTIYEYNNNIEKVMLEILKY